MRGELTRGPVMRTMLRFAVPMILGNLLQQCYNVADTLIVGRFLGANALAAVGSSFTLMTFLTSILLGLSMGSGTVFSIRFGQKDEERLREGINASFVLIGAVTLVLNLLVFAGIDLIIRFCGAGRSHRVVREYLIVILRDSLPFSCTTILHRCCGRWAIRWCRCSFALSAVLNILLDLWFVLGLERGVAAPRRRRSSHSM